MIPFIHLQDGKYLVPLCRLYASKTGASFTGFLTEGQRLVLRPILEEGAEKWKAFFVNEKEEWWELPPLLTRRSLEEGDLFLEGRFGMSCLIVKKNPRGLPDLTAYWAIKTPVSWCPSGCEFMETM